MISYLIFPIFFSILVFYHHLIFLFSSSHIHPHLFMFIFILFFAHLPSSYHFHSSLIFVHLLSSHFHLFFFPRPSSSSQFHISSSCVHHLLNFIFFSLSSLPSHFHFSFFPRSPSSSHFHLLFPRSSQSSRHSSLAAHTTSSNYGVITWL